jgi:hypothetical protein
VLKPSELLGWLLWSRSQVPPRDRHQRGAHDQIECDPRWTTTDKRVTPRQQRCSAERRPAQEEQTGHQ